MDMRLSMALPIADVGELDEDFYVGLIDDAAVSCLSVRLAAEGLLTPIWVRRNGNAAKTKWSVIAGRHRFRAAIKLGWTAIAAEERANATSGMGDLRRLQIAENLDRRDLRPIERACFIMDRWREAAAQIGSSVPMNQQGHAIRARWSVLEAISNTPTGDRGEIDRTTGEACGGKSDRWVRSYRKLYETIVLGLPDLFARLNAHPLGESLSAMTRLATFKHDNARRGAAEAVLSRDDWQSMDEALSKSGITVSTGNRTDPNRVDVVVLSAWSKMCPIRRRVTFYEMMQDVTPSLAREFADILKEKGLVA